MNSYKIVGRISSAEGQLQALAQAVPMPAAPGVIEYQMSARAATHAQAVATLKRMSVSLGREILQRGDQITTVELDEAMPTDWAPAVVRQTQE